MDKYSGSGFSKSGTVGKLFGYGSPKLTPISNAQFAVIDFETSGLTPDRGRVIEVAVLTLDESGDVLEEYSTLVNPEDGQVGLSMIHHIVPRMVEDAPTFRDIAEDLMSRLVGKVVVAHNATFEEMFLEAELKNAGVKTPILPALDTLQFLPRLIDLPDYKQSTVMKHMSIETDEHTALGDTRGLAKILQTYISDAQKLGFPVEIPQPIELRTHSRVSQRVTNLRKGESGWMSNLLPKLPVSSFALADFDRFTYWQLLLDILADGKITGEEIKQLAIYIGRSGLSQSDVLKLNDEFVRQQVAAANADGVVTKEEKEYLMKICQSLGVTDVS